MFFWDDLKDKARQEIAEVKRVPFALIVVGAIGIGAGWYVNSLFHQERFAVMEQRLATMEQRLADKQPQQEVVRASEPIRPTPANVTPNVTRPASQPKPATAEPRATYPTYVIPKPAVNLKWMRNESGSYSLILSTNVKDGLGHPQLEFLEMRRWDPTVKVYLEPKPFFDIELASPPEGPLMYGAGQIIPVPADLIAALRSYVGIRRMAISFSAYEVIEEVKHICINDEGSLLIEVKCPLSD